MNAERKKLRQQRRKNGGRLKFKVMQMDRCQLLGA
jgi:hypothetical protein